jgi:hypothetical protein
MHKREVIVRCSKRYNVVYNGLVPSAEPLEQVLVSELRTEINVSLNRFRELLKDRVEYFSLSEQNKRRISKAQRVSSRVDIVHHEEQEFRLFF